MSVFAHLNPHSSDFGDICALYSPFLHQLTMQSSLFGPGRLRPCPSYSRRKDRINLGLLRSFYKGGGAYNNSHATHSMSPGGQPSAHCRSSTPGQGSVGWRFRPGMPLAVKCNHFLKGYGGDGLVRSPLREFEGSFCGSYAVVSACFASCHASLAFLWRGEGTVLLGMLGYVRIPSRAGGYCPGGAVRSSLPLCSMQAMNSGFGVAVPTALPCIGILCRHRSRFAFWPHDMSSDCTAPCSTDAETGL